ncbi:anhydro-N-acetylmuramic acid kinase [Undibacterium fentianense]|uniref:Anhydro-N-acetylmuramic acid kinase n=1 Tax=Undibacterium fentianense TaxID=2828728 RepID=A0A941DZM0_9BURK|nr:anhydro-N-acetylmuramic acid kinase [Undibacterium fentianense]MBR7799735.1 anhydro-N-acetylmuramic acid kinase [Undibacterium fentianense]
MSQNSNVFIGLMSGTSLDGVDGVMVRFLDHENSAVTRLELLANTHIPFDAGTKSIAMSLQVAGDNEIEREALLANSLARIYAKCVHQLRLEHPDLPICAIGAHGQTIRHRPELGMTRQSNNPALLAELTDIDVIADFRSRDVAAGGQGAPLVPAFHRALFAKEGECRVVLNIGGISNISILFSDGRTIGFDTGPGNVLMDAWIHLHQGKSYDENGQWAAEGRVHAGLLNRLLKESFFTLSPPKSTGRDLFHLDWLQQSLNDFQELTPRDVQASLCALTAETICSSIARFAPECTAVYVCGGGAYNAQLMRNLQDYSPAIQWQNTDILGVAPNHVEALAFAWLARQFVIRKHGNLSEVTGAKGQRILGALYPA